jgi:hypothetical protein
MDELVTRMIDDFGLVTGLARLSRVGAGRATGESR